MALTNLSNLSRELEQDLSSTIANGWSESLLSAATTICDRISKSEFTNDRPCNYTAKNSQIKCVRYVPKESKTNHHPEALPPLVKRPTRAIVSSRSSKMETQQRPSGLRVFSDQIPPKPESTSNALVINSDQKGSADANSSIKDRGGIGEPILRKSMSISGMSNCLFL